jgi:hypothetical protein
MPSTTHIFEASGKSVPATYSGSCKTPTGGSWDQVHTILHILGSIMLMLTCLQGPGKLGVPDDREPDYTRYFVQAPVSELMSTHPVPDQLTVPANPTTDLTILIDFASMVSTPLSRLSHHLLICSCIHVARPPNLQEGYI